MGLEPAEFAGRLELFAGAASDAVAYVYARLAGIEVDAGLSLAGSLVGPACVYAETLPSRFPLINRGPGASLLAVATVPEPCSWTPDMPHLYQAEVQLRRGGEIVATASRSFGIRRLGAAERKLIYDGKRWVLRGVSCDEVPPSDLNIWRDTSTAMVIRNPSDALCDEASRIGVLLVAELERPDMGAIRRLARWPAVAMVVLPSGAALDASGLGHNLLLAERFAASGPVTPATWAQVALVEVERAEELAARVAYCHAAIIPIRPAGPQPGVAAARAACDPLQGDLARFGDWAGYIV